MEFHRRGCGSIDAPTVRHSAVIGAMAAMEVESVLSVDLRC